MEQNKTSTDGRKSREAAQTRQGRADSHHCIFFCLRCFDLEEGSPELPRNEFLRAVGQLRFRGTSALLRAAASCAAKEREVAADRNQSQQPHSPSSEVKEPPLPPPASASSSSSPPLTASPARKRSRRENEGLLSSFESLDDSDSDRLPFKPECSSSTGPGINPNPNLNLPMDVDEEDKASNYDFATHVVKVKRSGHVVDVKSLWDFESKSVGQFNSNLVELSFDNMLGNEIGLTE